MTSHSPDKHENREASPLIDRFSVPARYSEMITGRNEEALALSANDGPDGPEPHISSLQFIELCLRHFRESGRETLSTAPVSIPFGSFGLIVSGVAQAGNFGEALVRCVDVMAIMRPDMTAAFSKSDGKLRLDVRIKGPAPARTEIGLEFFIMALHSAFRWLTGERLRPVHVRAAGRSKGHERSLLTVLCCPMTRRDCGVTLSYPSDLANVPIRAVKYESWGAHELPEFLRLLSEAAEYWSGNRDHGPVTIVARVSRLVREGVMSEQGVARNLGVSSASLRRQLAEQGTSFRSILSDVRREVVRQLLLTDKSLASIAEEAGYSDERSLRRACVQWFGQSPKRYREAARQNSVQDDATGGPLPSA